MSKPLTKEEVSEVANELLAMLEYKAKYEFVAAQLAEAQTQITALQARLAESPTDSIGE